MPCYGGHAAAPPHMRAEPSASFQTLSPAAWHYLPGMVPLYLAAASKFAP